MIRETENPSTLRFLNIRHRYGARMVLEDISFSAIAGQWLVLFGESGCGKSTILRIGAGLERPEQGSVLMFGSDQSMIPSHQRPIAWMSQTADCYEHLSVAENLAIAERLARSQVSEQPIDIASWRSELIDELDLAPLMTRKPSAISGGERQRVAIARVLLSLRPILLFDEPLVHLNESMREKIGKKLREWTLRMRMTVLFVTHDSIEAAQLGDQMAILIGGRIAQVDAPKLIVDRPATERVADLTARLRGLGSTLIGR